jgi:hypothetical protein
VRQVLRFALLGALSGLLCCSPGLLVGLWAADAGIFLWQLLLSWWAPGVTYGVVVMVPLAIALKRTPVIVALFASAGGYVLAVWLTRYQTIGWAAEHPLLRLFSIPGAVGAAILTASTLPWRRASSVVAALLTIIAGAITPLMFQVDLFAESTWPKHVIGMLQYTMGYVVWQSATAACLSLGLIGRPPEGPSKSVPPGVGD